MVLSAIFAHLSVKFGGQHLLNNVHIFLFLEFGNFHELHFLDDHVLVLRQYITLMLELCVEDIFLE